MQQGTLLQGPWDSFLEALRDDIQALGGSSKVGSWFIPGKSQDAQRNYVNDRLNADRRERFADDQQELIMRRAVESRGYSAALFYLCDAIGTERPKAKNPETERDRAQRAFIDAAQSLERAVGDLKRLNVTLPFRSVV